MRLAGIFAPHHERIVERFLSARGSGNHHVVAAFPQEAPYLAVSAVGEPKDLHIASQAVGSFACVIGEIYNRAELCRSLAVPPEQTAAVVLALWRRDGEEGLGRINGQASFILWDATTERLALVRDRGGVPPIFFAEQDGVLLWATEMKTLLALGVKRDIDPVTLDAYLSIGYVPAPWTFVDGTRKVPAAHALIADAEKRNIVRYWRPSMRPKRRTAKRESVNVLRDRIREAFRRTTEGNGPFGVLLSGGVDSSLLAAGLKQWHDVPFTAFTFHYEGFDGAWNEYDRAKLLTKHLGISHEIIEMGPAWVAENLPALLIQHEEPFSFGLHTARLHTVREAGVETMLTGALPGFPGFWEVAPAAYWGLRLGDWSVIPWRKLAAITKRTAGIKALERLQSVVRRAGLSVPEYFEQKPVNTIVRDGERAQLYLNPDQFRSGRAARLENMNHLLADADVSGRFDRHAFLTMSFLQAEHNLWWNHRWGQANGLRFRFPYLDIDVVNFLARLRRDTPSKSILREVAATVMPRDIAFYPKYGQAAPIWQWLRIAPLRNLVYDTLTPRRVDATGLFRTKEVMRLVREHMDGVRSHQWLVWTVLSFCLWKQHFLDVPAADTAVPRILDY